MDYTIVFLAIALPTLCAIVFKQRKGKKRHK